MSARRETLPARRDSEALGVEFLGQRFRVHIGEYPDGRLGEVFINAQKPNSALDNLGGDVAILLSLLLLQHGVAPAAIGHALRRDPGGAPASLAGLVVAELAALDANAVPQTRAAVP